MYLSSELLRASKDVMSYGRMLDPNELTHRCWFLETFGDVIHYSVCSMLVHVSRLSPRFVCSLLIKVISVIITIFAA